MLTRPGGECREPRAPSSTGMSPPALLSPHLPSFSSYPPRPTHSTHSLLLPCLASLPPPTHRELSPPLPQKENKATPLSSPLPAPPSLPPAHRVLPRCLQDGGGNALQRDVEQLVHTALGHQPQAVQVDGEAHLDDACLCVQGGGRERGRGIGALWTGREASAIGMLGKESG